MGENGSSSVEEKVFELKKVVWRLAMIAAVLIQSTVPVEASDPVTSQLVDREGIPMGLVYLEPDDAGVRVHVSVSGLRPNTNYEFHFHEYAACDAPEFQSAGAYWNPDHELSSVAGELPNIRTDNDGRYSDSIVAEHASLIEGSINNPVLPAGSSLVLERSGARIACGTVEG
ncbi:superoxide dismutase [Cu-Zn] precursor [Geomicrobium sp. JCM 19039]|nr:superoxide dismutase [Cu-Zn] precursor [Geomicrobium sp. JCM 19039]